MRKIEDVLKKRWKKEKEGDLQWNQEKSIRNVRNPAKKSKTFLTQNRDQEAKKKADDDEHKRRGKSEQNMTLHYYYLRHRCMHSIPTRTQFPEGIQSLPLPYNCHLKQKRKLERIKSPAESRDERENGYHQTHLERDQQTLLLILNGILSTKYTYTSASGLKENNRIGICCGIISHERITSITYKCTCTTSKASQVTDEGHLLSNDLSVWDAKIQCKWNKRKNRKWW